MTDEGKRATCPHCGEDFTFAARHSGFAEEGYMYCDSDEAVLVWSFYGPNKGRSLVDKLPWTLDEGEKAKVEAAVSPCPCGGRFAFRNPPRCPHCFSDFSSTVPTGIHYVGWADVSMATCLKRGSEHSAGRCSRQG